MAEGQRDQFADFKRLYRFVIVFAVVSTPFVLAMLFAAPVRALSEPVGSDPSNEAVARSARWPVVLLSCGLLVRFARVPARPTLAFKVDFLVFWTLGCVLCLLHIAVAFHLSHGWSHEAAWEHTKQAGGYGDGIYVNYAFALVWLADVVWASVAFGSYLARPRWLNWMVYGFLVFVAFNAAVVFGSEFWRILFLLMFLIQAGTIGFLWWEKRKRAAEQAAAQTNADAEPDHRP
jgi:hypothetical protein